MEAGIRIYQEDIRVCTELFKLYSVYRRGSALSHLERYVFFMDKTEVIKTCEEAKLWQELVFLYEHYDEHDNAALTILDHSADVWDHFRFSILISKVCCRGCSF
jgi:clathrin heavy chain